MSTYKKFLLIFLIIILWLFTWTYLIKNNFDFNAFRDYEKSFSVFIHHHELTAIFIYASFYIFIVLLSIPIVTILTIIAGFLFGQILGVFIAVFSATIGATILFLIVRHFSRKAIQKKSSPWIDTIQKELHDNGFLYLFAIRLIPIFPFFATNFAAAILQIPLRIFLLGTIFGILPGEILYVSMGVGLQEEIEKPNFTPQFMLNPKILFALIGIGLLVLIPLIYQKYQNIRKSKKHKHH